MPTSIVRGEAPVFRRAALEAYPDIFTAQARKVLSAMTAFEIRRRKLMNLRMERRRNRFQRGAHASSPVFRLPEEQIGSSGLKVGDAREGKFRGSQIPHDLRRQWVQGTGPAARPREDELQGLRNVAYALLSGADGWMFDGEDALGQRGFMSLDNQRNLKLAIQRDPRFLETAEQVSLEMNRWSREFFGRKIIQNWNTAINFTTRIFRVRGLHLADRHMRSADGEFSGGICDAVLYLVHNHRTLLRENRSLVLYLPKIQTAEEALLWNDILDAIEDQLELPRDSVKVYVLVEQLEAAFQLMEIRAVLGGHFVGFNTGRWDYINSVSDALAGNPDFLNPNIESVTMTYPYMAGYEDRVRRAVNTPDTEGNYALWQGGMEPNIPVGDPEAVSRGMEKALAGARREQMAGASGKWVAHWKMVHVIRPVWEEAGEDHQMGRSFAPLSYDQLSAEKLLRLEAAPRTLRGTRNLVSVAMQYGNAFAQGYQAAALKPAEDFGDRSVLYLMEDAATGEIRMSILWEWIHKHARFTRRDEHGRVQRGDAVDASLVRSIIDQEFERLQQADPKDVHQESKSSTLPVVRKIMLRYLESERKVPWYIDLLNICLHVEDPVKADKLLDLYLGELEENRRYTANPELEEWAMAGETEISMGESNE